MNQNRKIHIFGMEEIGSGINTELVQKMGQKETVHVLHNTVKTQIRKQ